MAGKIDINKIIVPVENDSHWHSLVEQSEDKLLGSVLCL